MSVIEFIAGTGAILLFAVVLGTTVHVFTDRRRH